MTDIRNDILSILHLSDLHFSSERSFKQRLLIEPFFADLELVVNEYGRPDLIIFSGDLVQNSDEKEIYYKFIDFADRILRITGLPENRFLTCPGNHDVSFKALKDNSLAYSSINANRKDQTYIEKLYIDRKLDDYARDISKSYFEFSSLFKQEWEDPFAYTANISEINAAVIMYNTTLCCCLEGSEEDRGALSVPLQALERALERAENRELLIVAGHHSRADMHEGSSRILQDFLDKYVAVHLSGHLHDAKPALEFASSGELLYSQSGALYTAEKVGKSYQLIQVHRPTLKKRIIIRSYMDKRGEFDEGTDIIKGGVFFQPEDQSLWESVLPKINESNLKAWLKTSCAAAIEREYGKGYGERSIEDTFVYPPLARTRRETEGELELSNKQEEIWDLEDTLGSATNLVISVPEQFGSSSLLSYLALKFCKEDELKRRPLIPLIIDIRNVKGYVASAVRAMKSAHPEVEHSDFGWKSAQQSQPFVLLIDNFEPSNEQHQFALNTLFEVAPKARFIVCARTRLASTGRLSIDARVPFGHETLTLRPFSRKRLRKLVRNWSLPATLSEDRIVDEISTRFRALSIPLAGPHIAMFLTVIAGQGSFSPVNLSTVIENFVEELLDKKNLALIFRREMDYREVAGLLGYIAERFVRSGDQIKESSDVISWIRDYYDHIGIMRDAVSIFDNLRKQKVFEEFGGTTTFKYNVLYSYFIAYRMRESKEFKEYVVSYDNFSNFVHEIDLYCGLARQDVDVLAEIAKHFEELDGIIDADLREFSRIEILPDLRLPYKEDLDSFVKEFTETMKSDTDRDKSVEPIASPEQFRQNLMRRRVENSTVKWVLALRAYSVCIKNLESISKEQKEAHLERIIDAWGRLTTFCVILLGSSLEQREVEISGFKLKIDLGSSLQGKVFRRMMTSVPLMVSSFMRSDLASPKLELQLKSAKLQKNGTVDLLRTGLITHLKLPGFIDIAREFLHRNQASGFLVQAIKWKLRDVFLRYGFTEQEQRKFALVIAEIDADLGGLTEHNRRTHISRLLNNLSNIKNVDKLKNS